MERSPDPSWIRGLEVHNDRMAGNCLHLGDMLGNLKSLEKYRRLITMCEVLSPIPTQFKEGHHNNLTLRNAVYMQSYRPESLILENSIPPR